MTDTTPKVGDVVWAKETWGKEPYQVRVLFKRGDEIVATSAHDESDKSGLLFFRLTEIVTDQARVDELLAAAVQSRLHALMANHKKWPLQTLREVEAILEAAGAS